MARVAAVAAARPEAARRVERRAVEVAELIAHGAPGVGDLLGRRHAQVDEVRQRRLDARVVRHAARRDRSAARPAELVRAVAALVVGHAAAEAHLLDRVVDAARLGGEIKVPPACLAAVQLHGVRLLLRRPCGRATRARGHGRRRRAHEGAAGAGGALRVRMAAPLDVDHLAVRVEHVAGDHEFLQAHLLVRGAQLHVRAHAGREPTHACGRQ
mmetsp:Transcript_16477/g.51151  ORF Transcript_16477/g.51151 Transcript_16477/m.51151 type:complete len:213 (-) Transcript_16477:18-656(-)